MKAALIVSVLVLHVVSCSIAETPKKFVPHLRSLPARKVADPKDNCCYYVYQEHPKNKCERFGERQLCEPKSATNPSWVCSWLVPADGKGICVNAFQKSCEKLAQAHQSICSQQKFLMVTQVAEFEQITNRLTSVGCSHVDFYYCGHGEEEKCKAYFDVAARLIETSDQPVCIRLDTNACSMMPERSAWGFAQSLCHIAKTKKNNIECHITGNQCAHTGAVSQGNCVPGFDSCDDPDGSICYDKNSATPLSFCITQKKMSEILFPCKKDCDPAQENQTVVCMGQDSKRKNQKCTCKEPVITLEGVPPVSHIQSKPILKCSWNDSSQPGK
ncbi:MAG: hypothetical protein HY537_06775 [Deltaproteobacteria bacterium]|nr:hypothetical protein [Deltaproteobacteria bacterium]